MEHTTKSTCPTQVAVAARMLEYNAGITLRSQQKCTSQHVPGRGGSAHVMEYAASKQVKIRKEHLPGRCASAHVLEYTQTSSNNEKNNMSQVAVAARMCSNIMQASSNN